MRVTLTVYKDYYRAIYLVDQEEYAKAEADVDALRNGPIEDLKKYTDDLKAKAEQAADVRAKASLPSTSTDGPSSRRTSAASCGWKTMS